MTISGHSQMSMFKMNKLIAKVNSTLFITLIVWRKIDRRCRYENQHFICWEALGYFGLKSYKKMKILFKVISSYLKFCHDLLGM